MSVTFGIDARQPLRGRASDRRPTQGSSQSLATLGSERQPLRGKNKMVANWFVRVVDDLGGVFTDFGGRADGLNT